MINDKMQDFTAETIIENFPIGTLVFTIRDSKVTIITVNDRLLQFANLVHSYIKTPDHGFWDKDRLIHVFSDDLYAFAVDDDIPIVKSLIEEATQTSYSQRTFRLRGTFGADTKWINALCSCMRLDDETIVYYTLFLESTKQVLYEKQLLDKQKELEYIILYDSLTNVCNRYSYNQFLDKSKLTLKRQTGIIFADMNGLKAANDEFGHLFGDSLIVGFSELLLQHFNHDEIFRISGDEFVIIRENVSVVDFENEVKQLIRETDENHMAAIGYKWEAAITDLKQAIYQTEQLMMIQKQKYYIQSKSTHSKHRPLILKELLDEMDNHCYTVYLQPKAAIGSSKVIGAEALIRKINKDGKIVPPYEFVPILEKELLISKIDFFVLEEVCKLIHKWKLEGKRLIKISVNMSRVSMAETDFLEHVLSICDQYSIEHYYIEIEITESTDTKDNRKMAEVVSTLSELGFGVSLDDMGNDYSSIKMATMHGIDTIKIDRSLVLQIFDKEGAALIRYIIALCHEIGKKCIAEGVEGTKEVEHLKDMNCDYYQGYLLNRPIPIPEFEGYLVD